jgi:hypothetical protein
LLFNLVRWRPLGPAQPDEGGSHRPAPMLQLPHARVQPHPSQNPKKPGVRKPDLHD